MHPDCRCPRKHHRSKRCQVLVQDAGTIVEEPGLVAPALAFYGRVPYARPSTLCETLRKAGKSSDGDC